MKATHVQRWGKDKLPVIRWFARMAVISAQAWLDLRNWVRGGFGGKLRATITVGEWIRLYRRHRVLERTLLESFWPFGEGSPLTPGLMIEFREAWMAVTRMEPGELRRLVKEASPAEMNEGRELGQMLSAEFDKLAVDAGETKMPELAKVMEVFGKPEVVFAFRVWFPCWVEYGMYPPQLMRLARQGDIGALEKILWLDKLALYDPRIAEHWQEASWDWTRARFRRLQKALGEAPKRKASRRKLKVSLAGLISLMSELMEATSAALPEPLRIKRLTAPEIVQLFDAAAKDQRLGMVDPDLQGSPQTLAKAIQREKDNWLFLFGKVAHQRGAGARDDSKLFNER